MPKTAKKTDPRLWEEVKEKITEGNKGGNAGQWSARKAQLAVQEYKKRGGKYAGPKASDNSLSQWTKEDWGTKSGKESAKTGERYLPRKARKSLSPEEYEATSRKKRLDTAEGRQFSAQPKRIAAKTAPFRRHGSKETSKADAQAKVSRRGIEGDQN